MTNKSGNIGTRTARAVVEYLQANGWPSAERRVQYGNIDQGDITGTPGIAWEVKGGHTAERFEAADVEKWLKETELERRNASADVGVLVIKRKARGFTLEGVAQWWAGLDLADVAWLLSSDRDRRQLTRLRGTPTWLTLAAACHVLTDAGYGGEADDGTGPRQLFRDYLDPGTSEALEPLTERNNP